ncbi:hypothetical protein [Streptomyces sp. ST1015]
MVHVVLFGGAYGEQVVGVARGWGETVRRPGWARPYGSGGAGG